MKLASKRFIFFCLFLLSLSSQAQASSLTQLQNTAVQLGLASHRTWLKLLHYEQKGQSSVILTDSFFLSDEGKKDPKAELASTIEAYFSPWGENGNDHPRCQFPARYYWLSQKLTLPGYSLREDRCLRFEKWALLDSVKSISLLLVSGYFGNPASTFGHGLLKLNTDSDDDQSGFFDLTVNYGAMVPENEYILRYIVRGLGGGYEAGFSDRYFYTQDLVYSRTEFRDIWDYRLELTDFERRLLILHIWEVLGNKFTYYFLKENCAYRLAELVDLVIEEDIIDKAYPWYLPVELFHRLNDIDQARLKSHGTNLIQSVSYIPSSQRKLYHQLKLLTSEELKVFNVIIRDGINSMPTHLAGLADDQKILVLDSLLAYQQYRLIAEEGKDSEQDRREVKDKVLLARLRLPSRPLPSLEIPELPSPAEGLRPMEFGVRVASENNKDSFLRLNWAVFKKEMVGRNSLEGDEFVVLDLAVGIAEDGTKVFVDQFDLIRVLNLNTLSVHVVDESQLSWRLRIGVDRIKENGKNRFDGVTSFGAGPAWKLNKYMTGYGMVDAAAHSLSPYVRLRPHLGLKMELGEFRVWLYGGTESVNYEAEFRGVWGGKMQYQLNDKYAIHFEYSNEKATRTSVGFNLNW